MRPLVRRHGRTRVWLTLVGLLVVVVIITRTLNSQPKGIPPEEALAAGGHIVTVQIWCFDSPDRGQRFEVITLAGRPPRDRSGPISDSIAQVVVGPDWMGRVRMIQWESPIAPDIVEETDLIGEAFGWEARTVSFSHCR